MKPLSLTLVILLSVAASDAFAKKWTGDVGDQRWSTAKNWDPEGVPGEDNEVVIGIDSGGRPGVASGAVGKVKKLSLTDGATIDGGKLEVVEEMQWLRGTLSRVELTCPKLTLSVGTHTLVSRATLNCTGATTWEGGDIAGGNDAKIINTGKFEITCNNSFLYAGGANTATFQNRGTLVRKAGPLGAAGKTRFVFWNLEQGGLVDVQNGAIDLCHSGNLPHRILDGARFKGAGRVQLMGGTEPRQREWKWEWSRGDFYWNGRLLPHDTTPAFLNLEGTATFEETGWFFTERPTFQLAESAVIRGARDARNDKSPLAPAIPVSRFAGPATFEWTGGSFKDGVEIARDVTMIINGRGDKQVGYDGSGTLVTHGKVEWRGGHIGGNYGHSVFDNRGTFEARCDAIFTSGTTATFINAGKFIKVGSKGTTAFEAWSFRQAGVVDVREGTLELRHCANQTHQILAGSKFQAGVTRLVGRYAGLQVKGTATLAKDATFELAEGAAMRCKGGFEGPGTLRWTGGGIGRLDDGALVIAADTRLHIDGRGSKYLSDDVPGAIDCAGTVEWSDGELDGRGSVFINRGTFQATEKVKFSGSSLSTFKNLGTFIKDKDDGTARFDSWFVFENAGMVEVRRGALATDGFAQIKQEVAKGKDGASPKEVAKDPVTTLAGGKLVGGTYIFKAGTLRGYGVIMGNVVNEATLQVDAPPGKQVGTLTVEGNYTQTDKGALEVDIAGPKGGDYDVLYVEGGASLAGPIRVRLLGQFRPEDHHEFSVMVHHGGRTGKFSGVNGPAIGDGRTLDADYSRKVVTFLQIAFANPNPVVVLVSGGPGLYRADEKPDPHDAGWGNFAFSPLLMWDHGLIPATPKQDVVWFVYRPAYDNRWAADRLSNDPLLKGQVEQVTKAGFNSYAECLEAAATKRIAFIETRAHPTRERNWKIVWIESKWDFWEKMLELRRPIDRLYYWGHARHDLWLSLEHDPKDGNKAKAPEENAIIRKAGIGAPEFNAPPRLARSDLLPFARRNFQAGQKGQCQFWGCNTSDFAEKFAQAYGVPTMGWEGSITFVPIDKNRGQPGAGKDGKKREFPEKARP